jgi:hypothetical protein
MSETVVNTSVVKSKAGRPEKYGVEEWSGKICERIAEGESLVNICRDPKFPSYSTVLVMLEKHSDFSGRYARARGDQADRFAMEIVDIADSCDDPAKARLQIDARKWVASKMLPKKYGDKIDLEHSGEVEVVVRIGGVSG